MAISDSLNWLGICFQTGDIICNLPGIQIQGQLGATIGQPETANLVLNLDENTAPEWEVATTEGYGALIAWTGDPSAPVIVWGGVVGQRFRTPLSTQVQLSVSTPDVHLGSVYVGNLATTANQDTILAALMSFATGANMPPWVLIPSAYPSTQQQTVAYQATNSTTVLSAMQSLSAYYLGPEWMTGWQWNLGAGTIVPTLTYGSRVGQPADAVLGPQVTIEPFDLRAGSGLLGDYSQGHGANQAIALAGASSAASNTYATSQVTATAPDLRGRPLWSWAYTPSTQTLNPDALAQFAFSAVLQLENGSQNATLVIGNDLVGKQYGEDWHLGDDIGWTMSGTAFPRPVSGTARCVSVKVDQTTVTPTLQGIVL